MHKKSILLYHISARTEPNNPIKLIVVATAASINITLTKLVH